MDQLIQAFGIDVKLIVVQIINFGVLLAVLTYFLYRPILNLLEEREAKITQGIKDAEAAAAAKADAETEKRDILKTAHQEASLVADRAKIAAGEQSDAIVAAANAKVAKLLADAESAGVARKAQLERESQAEMAKLAMLAAEKILREKQSSAS